MRSLIYCFVLTLLADIIIPVPVSPSQNMKNENFYNIIKRNFLSREREYLKKQPLSDDLRNFIQRVKRRAKPRKRDSLDVANTEHMYVVQNGDIVPLTDTKSRKLESNFMEGNGDATADRQSPSGKFTVIPLIIPLTFEVQNPNITEICEEVSTTAPMALNHPTRHTILTSTTSEPPEQNEEPENDSSESTTANVKLLSKVIKDVEDLIKYQNDAKPTAETTLCNVSGDWDSYAGGMQIRIFVNEYSPRTPKVRFVHREPPMEGFLSANRWNVSAVVPYKPYSMIAIMAISLKGKKMASFIGECRICEGDETISGNWMLTRRSKSCKDREEANTFVSDVLRKNNIRRLQAEHLSQLTMSTSESFNTDNSDNIAFV